SNPRCCAPQSAVPRQRHARRFDRRGDAMRSTAYLYISLFLYAGCTSDSPRIAPPMQDDTPATDAVKDFAASQIDAGRATFRNDTFGDEAFWGGTLQLHRAIAGAANGGVGGGVSPKTALAVGLKVDVDALSRDLRDQLERGQVNL